MSKFVFTFVFLVVAALQSAECKNWALLVAGSSSYENYRHQADICHAYHVLRNHGIPAENIVTMMYDDIADSLMNPFKGNIINQPDGPNLYPGVKIDYRQEDVTPEIFLAVLRGDKQTVKSLMTNGTGRVIESGPTDHVFVNFADHGAPGLIAFPDDVLYAKNLEETLKEMHYQDKYKKMVLYVEACESGSMFEGRLLPEDISIYAATAANPDQSSYACYFDEHRQTYLGDVFSVNWMQDSDKEDLQTETLQYQYKVTKDETNTSQVMEYGDMSITKMFVAEFQGNEKSKVFVPTSPRKPTDDAVAAPRVPLMILQHKFRAAKTHDQIQKAAQALNDLVTHYSEVDKLFEGIVRRLNINHQQENKMDGVVRFHRELSYDRLVKERQPIRNWDCYTQAVDDLAVDCQGLKLTQDHYALQQLFILVNVCERDIPSVDLDVRMAVSEAIKEQPSLCDNL